MSSWMRVIGVVASSVVWGSTWPTAAFAQVRLTGEMGTEVRVFPQAASFAGQERHMASSFFAPSVRVDIVPGQTLTFAPFVRLISDRAADEPVAYLRTLAWSAAFPGGTATMGMQTVRWGSSRLASPVDVVNQKDRSFHPFSNARIGQGMLHLNVQRRWGHLELLMMSRVEPRSNARRPARLRSSSWIAPERVRYGSVGSGPPEFAGRWSKGWDGIGVAVSALWGTARDPILERIPGDPGALGTVYVPSRQVGLELHWTVDEWIVRSESAVRRVSGTPAYATGVAGIERQWHGAVGEVLVAAEYVWDSRGRRAGTLTQDDLYLEVRLRSASEEPVELSIKALMDRTSRSTVWAAALSRSVFEQWLVEMGSWQFWGTDLGALRRDGYLWMSFRRRF